GAAGAVTGAAERELQGAGLTGEDEAGGAHAAGDEHRLADVPVGLRNLGRAGGEGAGRALAVDEQLAPIVALDLGHVVGDVVYLTRAVGSGAPQDTGNRAADGVGDRLPVRPGEIGGGGPTPPGRTRLR